MIPVVRPVIGSQERSAVDGVLKSGLLAQGSQVEAFESEFSEEIAAGAACIAVNSGTSALHLSLLAAEIGLGDEVIVPSFTFAATANAVSLTGAIPIFADIDEQTFCMDPDATRALITPRTRAIMPVHLYGHPADLVRFSDLCSDHGLALFEDSAQAHGSSLQGRPVGTWGTAGSFSFYPTKNMTSGEGGMVVTTDDKLERRIRLLRNQGQERRYENEIVGFNNRMTDIHAAIGRVQLQQLGRWTEKRQANAAFFNSELKGVVKPVTSPDAVHVYHQYTIRVVGHDRDAFAAELSKKGVGTGVYYPIPVHRLPPFSQDIDLPVTERTCKEVLSLPIYPSLSPDELDLIVNSVNDVASAGS